MLLVCYGMGSVLTIPFSMQYDSIALSCVQEHRRSIIFNELRLGLMPAITATVYCILAWIQMRVSQVSWLYIVPWFYLGLTVMVTCVMYYYKNSLTLLFVITAKKKKEREEARKRMADNKVV